MSIADLADLLRRAAAAHHDHEIKTGRPDPEWPEWYAGWILSRVNLAVSHIGKDRS